MKKGKIRQNSSIQTAPIMQLISPFIKTLREDTISIISVNPSVVDVMREVLTYDDDDEEVIDVSHRIIGSEWVRISDLQVAELQTLKQNDSHVQYYKSHHLTAKYDADIKKGDILIRKDGSKFIVQDINNLYAEGCESSNIYCKSGTLGEFKD